MLCGMGLPTTLVAAAPTLSSLQDTLGGDTNIDNTTHTQRQLHLCNPITNQQPQGRCTGQTHNSITIHVKIATPNPAIFTLFGFPLYSSSSHFTNGTA